MSKLLKILLVISAGFSFSAFAETGLKCVLYSQTNETRNGWQIDDFVTLDVKDWVNPSNSFEIKTKNAQVAAHEAYVTVWESDGKLKSLGMALRKGEEVVASRCINRPEKFIEAAVFNICNDDACAVMLQCRVTR